MTRISLRSASAALLFAIISPPSLSTGGLQIPRKDLLARVHVIGVLPAINGVDDTAAPDEIDSQIAQTVRAAGFEVIEARSYRDTELAVRNEKGGWFDPFTGRWDRGKHDAILNEAMQTYLSRYKPDAFLRARVIARPMLYKDDKKVAWDGVEENIVSSETWIDSVNHGVGLLDSGEFEVLSLLVGLYDLQGQELFSGQGGIGAGTVLVKKKFLPVDVPKLLTDTSRIAHAAQIATGELVGAKSDAAVAAKIVTIGQLATPVTPPPPEAPVAAHRATIQKTVKTIAILPTDVREMGSQDSIQEIYYSQLSQDLKAAGYDVVSRWTTNHILTDASEQVSGTFDPLTGVPLEDRQKRAQAIQTQQLHDQQHVDALMYVNFPKTRLAFNQKGTVHWDGVSRSALDSRFKIDRFAAFDGAVNGLSLAVRLTDLDGKVLYSKRAGIELLAHFTGSIFLEQSWSQILEDSQESVVAAKSALSGLTDD